MIRWENGSAAASSGTASGESVSASGSTGLSSRALAYGFAGTNVVGSYGIVQRSNPSLVKPVKTNRRPSGETAGWNAPDNKFVTCQSCLVESS